VRGRRSAYRVWWGNLRARDLLKYIGVDGDNIKMDLQKVVWVGVDWFGLSQHRGWWRSHVNVVMKYWVP
jgi:hypothetical protein